MSQLMESALNRDTALAGADSRLGKNQQNIDFIKVLWRWKWLPVLGALIGAGTGFMFYTKLPAQYLSAALVQVVSAFPASYKADLYDPERIAYFSNRNDESRAIKSQTVLGLAVKAGKLDKYFPHLSPDAIVALLMDPKTGVDVQPAEKIDRSTTQQLFIAYRSNDPEAAHAVVNAVVAGYQTFLAEEYKTVDTEVLKFFANTEKRLAATYQDLFEQQKKIREEAPNVLWTGDDAADPFAESYMRLKVQLEDLRIRRTKLRGTLQHVVEAQKANRRPEDILVMLHDGGADYFQSTIWRQINESEKSQLMESEKLERTYMIPLRAREQQLLGHYGAAHPSVQTIRREIEVMEERIAAARQLEANEKLAKEKLLSRPSGGTADPILGGDEIPVSVDGKIDLASLPDDLTLSELMNSHWLEIRINALKEQYRAMERHEKDLDELAREELKKSQELQNFLSRSKWIKEQLASVKVMLDSFSEKVRAVELTPTNANQRILKELTPASPGLPDGPYPARYIGGGAVLGILLMSGLAVLMDLADRSYRSPDEIMADLGKPILGHIPAIELDSIKKVIETVDPSIITLHHSRGRIAEAFRSVRTSLFFSSRGNELKVIQVTSPVPGDGKSTMSANLAVAMAQSGRRVLLIDADFRRPRQHKLFGIEAKLGMAQLLIGTAELDEATYTTCVANLSLIPGGDSPGNPAELLSSSRFAETIELLREKYDVIIMDTPPLLAVSDPCVVAASVDGVVVTMRLRRNVKPLATRALQVLESVDAHVLGLVVNGVSAEAAYGGYGYNYSYNDYRDSYRYEGMRYGDGRYGEYSAGYIEDKQLDVDSALANDSRTGT